MTSTSASPDLAYDLRYLGSPPSASDAHTKLFQPTTVAKRSDRIVVPENPSESLLEEIEDGVTPCVVAGWELDPANPRAPSIEAWGKMTKAQQNFVDCWLMAEMNLREEEMPQGVSHSVAIERISAVLRSYLAQKGIRAFVGIDIMTHFPTGEVASPDVMVVLNPDKLPERTWHVGIDGGLPDVCFEVYHHGDKEKDTTRNVKMYAKLGIKEYFVFEIDNSEITGYRLGALRRKYTQIVSDSFGRYKSEMLELGLKMQCGCIEFYDGDKLVLSPDEGRTVAEQRAQEEAAMRTAAAQRAAEPERRAREAELRLLEIERRMLAAVSQTGQAT